MESSGLLESSKQMVGTLLAIFQTRLELLSNEIEEERLRIGQILIYGSLILFCFGIATVLLSAFIVITFWDSYRLEVLAGLTIVFLISALVLLNTLRSLARTKPRLFSASITELIDDRDRLAARP
ncbi:MAG: phage holin family protein [Gallionellaceae bacterium]